MSTSSCAIEASGDVVVFGSSRSADSSVSAIERPEVALPEQRLRCRDDRVRGIRAVHERRDLVGEDPLRLAPERLAFDELRELLDARPAEEGEDLEPVDHVGVVGVEPELVEAVRAAHLGVEPDGVALALAELRAVGVRDERRADGVHAARPRPGG